MYICSGNQKQESEGKQWHQKGQNGWVHEKEQECDSKKARLFGIARREVIDNSIVG